jgi:hypothetical protein
VAIYLDIFLLFLGKNGQKDFRGAQDVSQW